MAKKEDAPDVKVEDGNASQEVVKIEGNVAIEATGDVTVTTPTERTADVGGAKAVLPEDIQAVMDANPPAEKPKTKKVVTGKNVMTGKDVVKEVPVPYVPDYSAGRKEYEIHTATTGSFNGRKMNLVAGEKIYLNDKELKVFGRFVKM